MDGARGGQGQRTEPQSILKHKEVCPGRRGAGGRDLGSLGQKAPHRGGEEGERKEGEPRKREQMGGREREVGQGGHGPGQGSEETRGTSREVTVTFVPTEVQVWRLEEKAGWVCGGEDQRRDSGGCRTGRRGVEDPLLLPAREREAASLVSVKGPGQDERSAGGTQTRASCGTPAAPAGCWTARACLHR